MTAWFSERDRDLMKRLTLVVAFALLFTASFCHVQRTYSQKFFDVTGEAQWIWARHSLSSNEPLAFFAGRDFTLPEKRAFTRLKIGAIPEYTLYVNGREVVSRRAGANEQALDVVDISPLVKTGPNRIVVAVRAPQGFGGLIAAVDLAAENAAWLVTDDRWKIYRRWNPVILTRDVPGEAQSPMRIGEPPVGRWNFLTARPVPRDPVKTDLVQPARVFRAEGKIPVIRTKNGIAVAGVDRETATVFDFGPMTGRVRLTLGREAKGSRLLQLRFAHDLRDLDSIEWNLRPVVFAPGERVLTSAEAEQFRYVMVFGRNVTAEAVR